MRLLDAALSCHALAATLSFRVGLQVTTTSASVRLNLRALFTPYLGPKPETLLRLTLYPLADEDCAVRMVRNESFLHSPITLRTF
jgi:hypothetical protein